MNLNNLYIFDSTISNLPVTISNENLNWEINCGIVRGDYTGVVLPVIFKQISGKIWTDILNPNSVSMYVVSQRFIELLEKNKITGWRGYPVTIIDKEGKSVVGYVGFSIIGRSGPVDYSKAVIYEKQLVHNGAKTKYYKGLYIDMNKWDVSDFFIPEGTLNIIISEKAMRLIKKYKITNVNIQNITEYEISENTLPKNISLGI